MELNLNFNAKTKLSDWWKQVKSLFETVQSSFNTERSERIAADSAFENILNTEISERRAADSDMYKQIVDLQSDAETEQNNRTAADTSLRSALNEEIATRKTNERTLQSNITSMQGAILTSVRGMIKNEKNERLEVEEELRRMINEVFHVTFSYTGELPEPYLPNPNSDIAEVVVDLRDKFTVDGVTCSTMPLKTLKITPGSIQYLNIAFNIDSCRAEPTISGNKIDQDYIENNIWYFTLGSYDLMVLLNDVIDSPDYGKFYIQEAESNVITRKIRQI